MIGDELVEVDEIGVCEVGERSELALEAKQCRGIAPPQHFERDRTVTLVIKSFVHLPEATAANLSLDSEAWQRIQIHVLRSRRSNRSPIDRGAYYKERPCPRDSARRQQAGLPDMIWSMTKKAKGPSGGPKREKTMAPPLDDAMQ